MHKLHASFRVISNYHSARLAGVWVPVEIAGEVEARPRLSPGIPSETCLGTYLGHYITITGVVSRHVQ